MPRVRLTGLFLFITAIFLGLASAATQTSHLRFKSPDFSGDSSGAPNATEPGRPPATSASPETDPSEEMPYAEAPPAPIRFISIPMLYPLTGVGLLGLALWFVPGGLEEVTRSRTRNKGSRKSRSNSSQRRPASKGLSLLASRNARRKRR